MGDTLSFLRKLTNLLSFHGTHSVTTCTSVHKTISLDIKNCVAPLQMHWPVVVPESKTVRNKLYKIPQSLMQRTKHINYETDVVAINSITAKEK